MKNYRGYHNYNIREKIHNDALFILQRTLDGYASYEVTVNGTKNTDVLLYQKWDADGEAYKIVGYPEDIERGNLIVHDNETWLIATKPETNRVYRKAEMKLCTAVFPIVTKGTEVLLGYDDIGRPVYEYTNDTAVNVPCVVKMNDASTAIADTNKAANLLDNQVMVTIPYQESPSIEYNERFELYRDTYRIIRINPADSINGVGILHITGERVGSSGED